ncbi:MAG: hypothetical protein Kow0089_04270 [Desulfobulbaceae bacterium]
MLIGLFQNVAVLVALSSLYGLVVRLRPRTGPRSKPLAGLLFGAVAVIGMILHVHYAPGIIYDGRSIILTLAGLFGGGSSVAVAVLIAGGYRLILGGAGVWGGVATIVACGLVGLAFRRGCANRPERIGVPCLYLAGITAHLAMLACQLLILPWPAGVQIIERIWLPVMLVFPLGTVLAGMLIRNEEQRFLTEQALRESEEKFITAFRAAPVLLSITRREDGFFLDVNDTFCEVTEYSRREVVGRKSTEVRLWADPRDRQAMLEILEREGRIHDLPVSIRTKSGEIKHTLFSARPVSMESVDCLITTALDVTEQVRTEQALREWEELFSGAFNASPAPITITRIADGTFIDANEAFMEMFEFSREEVIGRTSTELGMWTPEARQQIIERQLATGGLRNAEMVATTRSGRPVHLLFSSHPLEIAGEPCHITTLIDITERKRVEETLRNSEREARLFNRIAECFLNLSDDEMYGGILRIIQEAMQSPLGIIGYIDEEGNWRCPSLTRDVWDRCRMVEGMTLFPKETWAGTWGRAMRERKPVRSNRPFAVPEGHVPITRALDVPIVVGEQLVGNLIVAGKETDYSEADQELLERIAQRIGPVLATRLERDRERREKENAEEQLLQAQKLESIGRLAGGVAHDFNNMLSVIIGYGETLLVKLSPEDPMREDIRAIVEAGKRSADLTRQLLAFSRKQTLRPRVLDLNGVVRNMEKMLRRMIGEDIDLELALSEELSRVRVDPGQINQVILNLAVNARDAMPSGGRLLIETGNATLDETYAGGHTGVIPGDYVMLAMTDTGCGMDSETVSHIFEPFFTTKEKGKGTGLGLSTVYGIIKQSGGNIWVYSEPGKGTTFKIYLPATEEEAQAAEHHEAGPEPGGSEHVLVVEDEESLRKLVERILTRHGYRVTLAANGGEALLMIDKGLRPDLLVTDVVMPGMSGRELAERLQQILPDMKVLYMSGYTDNAIVHHGVLDKGIPFIQKPFSTHDLAAKVRRVLETPSPGTD